MRRIVQVPIILIAFFILNQKVFAQTLAGGEVYYELISPLKYKVTAHIYRFCDYSPLNSLNANVYGGSTSVALNFQRISISKINDTCNNPCNKQNAISNPGFEKHTFIDTVDFNYAPYNVFVSKGICTVNFGVRQSGRVPSLSTLSSGSFYLDASTNICLSNITKNTSPQFSLEPKFKVGCNQPVIYSPGLIDTTDNDSFSFELAEVQSNFNTSVTYNGSFSSQIPMTPFCLPSGVINCKALPNAKPPRGFYLDPFTGVTSFTPSNCGEEGVIKYKINEYRYNKQNQNYEWLGYVTREMYVQVVYQTNYNPVIPTSNFLSVCENNQFCITVKTTDANSSDTTTLFWDQGIKNVSLNINNPTAREKEAQLCGSIKRNGNRLEAMFFTIGSYDKKCNLNLTSKTFKVKAAPTPLFTYKNERGKCGLIKWTSSVYDSLYPKAIGSCATTIKLFSDFSILYSGTGLNDSVNIHKNGKVIIEHVFKSGSNINCQKIVQDTITVSDALELPSINDNKDSNICVNSNAIFKTQLSQISNLKKWSWLLNDSIINTTDSIINLKVTKTSKIKLQVENVSACLAERTSTYSILQHNAIVNTNNSYCLGERVKIQANINNLHKPLNYHWSINGVDTSFSDSTFSIVIDKDKKVRLTLTDARQCAFKDSVLNLLYINSKLKLVSDSKVCRDSLASIQAVDINQSKNYSYLWKLNGKDTLNKDSILNFKVVKDSKVSLKIVYQAGCSISDSIEITSVATPHVNLSYSPYKCTGSLIKLQPSISNRPDTINYVWTINKAIISRDSQVNRNYNVTTTIKVNASNSLGCSTEDTATVYIYNGGPAIIKHVGQYHPSSFITLSLYQSFSKYKWFNGATTSSISFWANTLGPAGNYNLWCLVTDKNGCEYNDTAKINTNAFLNIASVNLSGIHIYPNPIITVLNIELNEATHIELYTIDGKLLFEKELIKGLNTIDMKDYSTGLYVLKAMVNGQVVNLRIVKD